MARSQPRITDLKPPGAIEITERRVFERTLQNEYAQQHDQWYVPLGFPHLVRGMGKRWHYVILCIDEEHKLQQVLQRGITYKDGSGTPIEWSDMHFILYFEGDSYTQTQLAAGKAFPRGLKRNRWPDEGTTLLLLPSTKKYALYPVLGAARHPEDHEDIYTWDAARSSLQFGCRRGSPPRREVFGVPDVTPKLPY